MFNKPITKFVITEENASLKPVNAWDAVNEYQDTSYTFSEGGNFIEIELNTQLTIRGYSVKCAKDQFPLSVKLKDV